MNKVSEFVLLTDVHCLNIFIIIAFVQNTGKSALQVFRIVELENTIVQECCNSLWKFCKTCVNWLLFLKVQVWVFIDRGFKKKMSITFAFPSCLSRRHDYDLKRFLTLNNHKPKPFNLIWTFLFVKRYGLYFHWSIIKTVKIKLYIGKFEYLLRWNISREQKALSRSSCCVSDFFGEVA